MNARAVWLLIREFAGQLQDRSGNGRIIALTSDHVPHNLPYGASKGALDRIVIAAARELAELRVTANVINPGPIDTGWMTEEMRNSATAIEPTGPNGHSGRRRAGLIPVLKRRRLDQRAAAAFRQQVRLRSLQGAVFV